MSKRKREREILHNYMEVLARNYEKFEPAEMTGSICRIYDSLKPTVKSFKICFFLGIANLFVGLIVLFKNFFRR